MQTDQSATSSAQNQQDSKGLLWEVQRRSPREAAELLENVPTQQIVDILTALNPAIVQDLLLEFPQARKNAILAIAPLIISLQWSLNEKYAEESVGRLMEPPMAVFGPDLTVGAAI